MEPSYPEDTVVEGGVAVNPAIGLIAGFTFDRNIGADSAVTLVGTEWVEGASFDALSVAGAGSYARLENHPGMGLQDEGSIAAWLRPDPHTAYTEIIRKGDGASHDWLLQFWQAQGQLVVWIRNGSGSNLLVYSRLWLPEDVWAHVAGTWDASELRLYINGALDATVPNTIGQVRDGGNVLLIGDGFEGAVDELQIYDRALTSAEVERIFHTGWP
jgi:hypothetical protein